MFGISECLQESSIGYIVYEHLSNRLSNLNSYTGPLDIRILNSNLISLARSWAHSQFVHSGQEASIATTWGDRQM